MSARQPCKVASEITSFMKCFYILKRRKHFWWNNLVLVLWHIMKWWCNTVGYKSLTVPIYRGQLYDVMHWIKSYINSAAILIIYHSFSLIFGDKIIILFLNWTWNKFDVNHHFVNSTNILALWKQIFTTKVEVPLIFYYPPCHNYKRFVITISNF